MKSLFKSIIVIYAMLFIGCVALIDKEKAPTMKISRTTGYKLSNY